VSFIIIFGTFSLPVPTKSAKRFYIGLAPKQGALLLQRKRHAYGVQRPPRVPQQYDGLFAITNNYSSNVKYNHSNLLYPP